MVSELTCSAKFSKILLILCNLVIALAGVALVACGIWFVSDPKSVHLFHVTTTGSLLPLVRGAGGIIIGVGLLVALVGFLGCCGALRQKTGCLDCFTVLLIIFVIMEIVATILAGVFHSQVTNSLQNAMNDTIQHQYGFDALVNDSWDYIQYEFMCCGAKDYEDWSSSLWKANQTSPTVEVPPTCCEMTAGLNSEPVNKTVCDNEARIHIRDKATQLHMTGCATKFTDWLRSYWGVLIGIVVAVIVIQVSGIVLTCCLISGIKKGYEYV